MKCVRLRLSKTTSFTAAAAFGLIVGAGSLTIAFNISSLAYGISILLISVSLPLSIAAAIQRSRQSGYSQEQLIYVTLVFLLYACLITTATYSTEPSLYQDNLLLSIAQPLLMFIAIQTLLVGSVKFFLWVIKWIAVLTALRLLYSVTESESLWSYGSEYAESYLTTGTMMALGLLIFTGQYLALGRFSKTNVICVLILVLGVSISLARAPIVLTFITLFFVIPVVAFAKFDLSKALTRIIKFYAILLTCGFGVLIIALNNAYLSPKLHRLLDLGKELELGGRGNFWIKSWSAIESSPIIGHGIGTSGILSGSGASGYPHNIVLEAWIEGGLIAMLLVLSVLIFPVVVALKNTRRLVADPHAIGLLMCVIYLSLEYMKSETLYAIQLLLICSIVFITLITRKQDTGHMEFSSAVPNKK